MTGHPSPARAAGQESGPPRLRRAQALSVGLMTVGLGVLALIGPDLGRALARFAAVVAAGLALAWAQRRFRPAPAALILAVLGLAIAVAATTVAVPHLLATGASATGVAAAVAAAGGLLAVSCAAVRFVHLVPGWRRMVLVPVVIVAGYAVYLPLGVAVYATHAPRTELAPISPADRNLTYQPASFTSTDGIALSGWYIPSTNHAAVLLLPGSGSTRTAVLEHAVVLARHGYGVLLVDPRGQGTSGGQAMEFGWFGEPDVAAAVSFLHRQPDVEPGRIAAVGLSMGGEEAIGALAADPRIRAVVAEGATNRVAADKAWLVDAYGLRGRLQLVTDEITYGLADLLTDAPQPISLGDAVAAAAPRPVLLIAGGGTQDEVAADRAIQARSPGTVQLWIVPGAAHIAGLAVAPAEWESRVTDFLGGALF